MAANPSHKTTLLVKDCCLCLHVQRAARALARRFDDAFRPVGLTNGQFSMLMALNRPDPPAMAPVALLLAMNRTTLTAAVKPLRRRGLVRIKADSRDNRVRLMTLTAKGKRLLARAVPIWKRTHVRVEGLLGKSGPTRLRKGLQRLA